MALAIAPAVREIAKKMAKKASKTMFGSDLFVFQPAVDFWTRG
jgi:hypothetical protein